MIEKMAEDDILDNEVMSERYRTTVDQGQDLVRIDKYLDDHIPGISRNKIQEAAKAGCIIVNGTPAKSNYRVHPGDEIQVLLPGVRTLILY